jgi:hypothetical protein
VVLGLVRLERAKAEGSPIRLDQLQAESVSTERAAAPSG